MKQEILGIVRHILTTFGGIVVANGHATQDEVSAIIGGVIAAVGIAWSLLDKKKRKENP